jgi:CRP-like cAMP-binding protein
LRGDSKDDSASRHRLAEVPIFASLPPALLDELASASRLRSYPAGQIFWSEGDDGDALLVLESGLLRVSRIGENGQEVVLSIIEPPAALGELALLDGAPRSATVTAQRPVMVRLIPRSSVRDLLRREPAAVDGLLKALAGMVRAGNERHARTVGLDVPGRLAAWLLDHATRLDGGRTAPDAIVSLNRSQGELAAELGTTRSTLNRALKEFEEFRMIAVDGDQVTLLRPDALARYTR